MPYSRSDKGESYRPAAFTLIEILVTIGVLAVLIAILIPALAGARAAGSGTVTLSNLRQLAATFEQYLRAYDQTWPYAPPGAAFVVSPPDDGEIDIVYPGYWELDIYWTALMHDVAPWREHFRTWIGPGAAPDESRPWRRDGVGVGVPSYRLSHTLFARPELWAPAPESDPAFYRPVRSHDVLYPSSKATLWDAELTHLRASPNADRDPRAMTFADGHVAVRRLSEAAVPPIIPSKPDTKPVQDTPRGARGRDY